MEDKTAPGDFDYDANEATAVEGNRALLEEIARSFRRVRGDETFDDTGVRTIWHQGHLRTEMLSWENRGGSIIRQELSFFGMLVECREGKPVRTGKIPLDESLTGGGARPSSALIKMDAAPIHRTLDYASHLLKHAPARDYYAQHLLKHVNETLNRLGFDEGRTVVSSLDSYSKRADADAKTTQKTEVLHPPTATSTRLIVLTLLGTAAILLGLGLGLLFW